MTRYDVEAFILAGGRSSRMLQDKSLLELGGVPLIVRTARLVKSLVSKVTVIGEPRTYVALGLTAIPDRVLNSEKPGAPPLGPLAGIVTALSVSVTTWNLILACDLPYLTAEWLDLLLSKAIRSSADVVLPKSAKGLDPLAGVYRRECRAQFSDAFALGVRSVIEALATVRVETIFESEWHELDPDHRVLKNMNGPEDYEEARRWWDDRKGT
jgi:molybdopterin-guanine dinucleotide biosynthesis protein A